MHLEVANPDQVLERFQPFKADSVTVCFDTVRDQGRVFSLIRSRNTAVGLSLDPKDSPQDVKNLFRELDLLIILGVFPGFGGQQMHPNTIQRIAEARRLRDEMGLRFTLAVDGGVNMENAPALVAAGADTLIIGTALFRAPRMAEFVQRLNAAVQPERCR